jgi:hypothetical protein
MTHIASSANARRLAPVRHITLASGIVVLTLWACDPNRSPLTGAAPTSAAPLPKVTTSASASPAASSRPAATVRDGASSKLAAPAPAAADETDDIPVVSSRYLLDGLNDVGPAAPAAAFAEGVVMVTRSDELSLAKLRAPLSKSKKSVASEIGETTRGRQDFWPVARGPAVSSTHAYWISKGRLVRRSLAGGELEVLAGDARDGTRVALVSAPDIVAYIAAPVGKQDSLAKLRLPDGRILVLTPEGAAASSVALARVGDDIVASYIDGRSGMTPVHARKLNGKTFTLDPDVVVWVSGATQGMTEIVSVGTSTMSWLILPVERDSSRFGLATLAVDREPKMDPPLRWRTYANGLDRAPAASASLCGSPTVIYVRPADARPGASQELVMSELTLAEIASSEPIATARGFADVSLYPLPQGAMLAYVADRRTWARLIRCK